MLINACNVLAHLSVDLKLRKYESDKQRQMHIHNHHLHQNTLMNTGEKIRLSY